MTRSFLDPAHRLAGEFAKANIWHESERMFAVRNAMLKADSRVAVAYIRLMENGDDQSEAWAKLERSFAALYKRCMEDFYKNDPEGQRQLLLAEAKLHEADDAKRLAERQKLIQAEKDRIETLKKR
jgi:hypothetical protein